MENLKIFETLETCRVRLGYSGRGMAGAETTALIADSKDDVLFELAEIIDEEAQGEQSERLFEAIEALKEVINSSVDNLGKDEVVIY